MPAGYDDRPLRCLGGRFGVAARDGRASLRRDRAGNRPDYVAAATHPVRNGVARIEPDAEGLQVELVRAPHAGDYLRRSNADFDELRETLQAALERICPGADRDADDHEIIDVRPLEKLTKAKG